MHVLYILNMSAYRHMMCHFVNPWSNMTSESTQNNMKFEAESKEKVKILWRNWADKAFSLVILEPWVTPPGA